MVITRPPITFIFILFFLFFQITTKAQEVVSSKGKAKMTGIVIDSLSGKPIEYATITLFLQGDKKPVNGATSDTSGIFVITDVKEGNYRILVESIGYKPSTLKSVVVNKKKWLLHLKDIRLSKDLQMLQSVTVVAPHDLIENKIDKIVFNAEKDLTSQGGVATDILKKVPLVSVDVDGNVELAGSSGIRFLIDGKPSTAFGNNIADVLQSIPASQIKSIEVITNPGAKYDAQGLGGIINIILKKNTAKGVNGNLSITAGTRIENGSFNFNARKNNFGLNFFVSGNERLSANTPFVSDRLSSDTASATTVLLHQDGSSKFTRHGLQSGLGFDWTINKKNVLSGSVSYNQFGNSGNGLVSQSQLTDSAGVVMGDINTMNYSNSSFLFHSIDAGIDFKKTFPEEDRELEIALNSSFGNNQVDADSYQLLQPQDSLYFGNKSNNSGREHETELQVDYMQPIKKDFKIGTGGKINFRDISSSSFVQSYSTGLKYYMVKNFFSNYLSYHQKVYALYAEVSLPVFKLFDAKTGVRYERTDIHSFYSNAQQQAGIPGYNTFVPSIFFSKKLAHYQTIKLSYSKRIERPDYRDLNPFINTTDPKNISAGNPYLKPEIGHRIELGYSRDLGKMGSFMVTAFYRENDNDIQPYIVFYPSYAAGDSIYYNVAVSTNQNIGLEKNFGLSLFVNLHVTSRLDIRSNLFFFERHTINKIDAGYNYNSFNYRLNINTSYQFGKDFAAEFFGNFNSPRHEAQGKYPSFTSYSIAMRKQVFKKKASIALTATNLFNEYVNQRTEVFGTGFNVNSLRQVPFRSIDINLTYKFGKLKFKKEREDNGALNDANEQ